jgi:hypothetical protein
MKPTAEEILPLHAMPLSHRSRPRDRESLSPAHSLLQECAVPFTNELSTFVSGGDKQQAAAD